MSWSAVRLESWRVSLAFEIAFAGVLNNLRSTHSIRPFPQSPQDQQIAQENPCVTVFIGAARPTPGPGTSGPFSLTPQYLQLAQEKLFLPVFTVAAGPKHNPGKSMFGRLPQSPQDQHIAQENPCLTVFIDAARSTHSSGTSIAVRFH